MIFILNSVFNVVFYAMRWTKLDITYICFKELINQLNLLYICIYLYSQQNKNYGTPELGCGPIFFVRPSLAQWAASEIFIYFYIFNFDIVFFMHIWSVFILSKKDLSSFYNFKFYHIIPQHHTGLSTSRINNYSFIFIHTRTLLHWFQLYIPWTELNPL
jgi:hypothetical protein